MSDEPENIQPANNVEEDFNTTPPNPPANAAGSAWSMPEPVFRKTSGYLPQGFEKKYSQEEVKQVVDDDISTASIEPPVEVPDIEPQPDIVEHTDEFPVMTAAPVAKKSGSGRIVFTILGLLLALGLIAIFFAVVYYLFFLPSPSTTF
ncbi:MAG: hypothetical protein ACRD6X_03960 [Pyrinomonadaceae bacterium]